MKVDLFIHGVPNGEGFWGKEDDRNYFGTFYDHSTDEVKFVIQNRVSKGKPYCYYNYLVYKTVGSPTPNVVANDGRDGSYFGISLRIDAYCKDVMNMYRILDTIYNIYVWGDLLKMERSKLKYSFSDFSNIEAKLKNIENATFKLVQNGFYADSFMPLDGFSNSGGNVPVFNLYEMTAADALQAVKQYGKIIVSPYYPTMRERQIQQQCDSQIAVFRQQWDREKTELNSSLTPLKEQVSALRQDISTRDNTISQLQRDLQNAKQNKNISQLVATLKDPITELSRTLRTILPDTKISHTTSSQPSVLKKVSLFAPIVNFWLLVLLICLLGLILNKETVHQSEVPPHVVEVITDTASQNETGAPDEDLLTTDSNTANDTSDEVDDKNIEEHPSPFSQKDAETPKSKI